VPTKISDLHIAREEPLPPPRELHEDLPVGGDETALIARSRRAVQEILLGKDRRLRDWAPRVADTLFLVMRVYFEKPRTRMGWKGLIYDPDLNGHGNIREGLRHARRILLECARLRVPAASEILDLVTPQYYAELLTWGAIGARTTESPLHRQMASALSAPVGFKNPTNGNIQTAVDAILAAAQPHKFPSISIDGRAVVVTTTGNPSCHLVLRGTGNAPNYDAAGIQKAADALAQAGLPPRLMVDCSHDNSGKDHRRQFVVAAQVAGQIAGGSQAICGVMLESHLVEGRQDIVSGRKGLRYGQSVTDACMGWETTVEVLERLVKAVGRRSPHIP